MILSNVKYVNVEKTSCHANTPDGWDHYFPAVEGNNFWDEVVLQEITPADYTDPPATMQGIRNLRNQLLKDTDWQGMSDVTMSDAQKHTGKSLEICQLQMLILLRLFFQMHHNTTGN